MPWWDNYKTWDYTFRADPIQKRTRNRSVLGVGVTQPEAIPDIRQDGSFWGGGKGGLIRLRDSNDFIDLSSVTNRQSRYKEYERLRMLPEIEMALNAYADEACLAPGTVIVTPFYGPQTIKWLTENKADERFLVYCWDFEKEDFTLGWAHHPRKVKTAPTVRIKLDDGTFFTVTHDHRILLADQTWKEAGDLVEGDELMAFLRKKPHRKYNDKKDIKTKQFPRIYTHQDGWKHERLFIDEWRTGKKDKKQEKVQMAIRALSTHTVREASELCGHDWHTLGKWIENEGYTLQEIRLLNQLEKTRRVIDISKGPVTDVYDLSVDKHMNMCGESVVFHNCQKGENGHICRIDCQNEQVKEELEKLLFHRKRLNIDDPAVGWNWFKRLCLNGDLFLEVIIDLENPKDGIYGLMELPPESMFRIETTKGKLVEFQQSADGPDYQSLTRAPVTTATEADLMQTTATRFKPEQIIHMRLGDDRKTFYPYGVSLVEAARGPAHQLRLMEDAMIVYRLTRAPERRVFYIDVGSLTPARADSFMQQVKDQFRKKKVATGRGGTGASAVEERWAPPAADEDFWLPIRPNSNTRIDTLPGAQNLGEIDDALYFRNKLYVSLNIPKNYFANEDPQATRISLSAQDARFARVVERLQATFEKALVQICELHLALLGVPEEDYEDLEVHMTPCSNIQEQSKNEIITNRINNANALKGSMIISDFDILTRFMHYTEDEAHEMLARQRIQKLEDFKLQVLAQNPQLLGVGVPGPGETEIGAAAGGPNPMLGPDPTMGGMGTQPPMPQGNLPGMPPMPPPPTQKPKQNLPEPAPEDLKRYDLDIQNYELDQDEEEVDFSEL